MEKSKEREVKNSILYDPKREAIICPFHDEKTPSLVLDRKNKTAHCFGCDKDYTMDQVEDAYRHYAKFKGLSFDDWFKELKEWVVHCGFDKNGFDPESLDPEDWTVYYKEGYAPGAALVEDLSNGI